MEVQLVKKPVTMATRPLSSSLLKRRRSPLCVITCTSGTETCAATGQPWSCAERELARLQKRRATQKNFITTFKKEQQNVISSGRLSRTHRPLSVLPQTTQEGQFGAVRGFRRSYPTIDRKSTRL